MESISYHEMEAARRERPIRVLRRALHLALYALPLLLALALGLFLLSR